MLVRDFVSSGIDPGYGETLQFLLGNLCSSLEFGFTPEIDGSILYNSGSIYCHIWLSDFEKKLVISDYIYKFDYVRRYPCEIAAMLISMAAFYQFSLYAREGGHVLGDFP